MSRYESAAVGDIIIDSVGDMYLIFRGGNERLFDFEYGLLHITGEIEIHTVSDLGVEDLLKEFSLTNSIKEIVSKNLVGI